METLRQFNDGGTLGYMEVFFIICSISPPFYTNSLSKLTD